MTLRLAPLQVRMLAEMGIVWLSTLWRCEGFVWVAVTISTPAAGDRQLLRNIFASIEAFLGADTLAVTLAEGPRSTPAVQWLSEVIEVPENFGVGVLMFGPNVAVRLLGSPLQAGVVRNAGRFSFVQIETLSELSRSSEAKRRLWSLLCEIPKRDTPSVTFPVVG